MDQSQSGTNGIGQRLRELRQKRGLNQQDLASADISVSYVSLIETGKRAPSETVLKALAERVGCTVDYLRTGRDDARVKELELKVAFGDMALRNGSNGEALQSYSEALANAPLLGEATVRRARLGQALAFEKLGRLEAAIQLFNTLFEDPGIVPGSAEWAQLAVALCRAYRDAGDQVLSVEVGERAMKRLDQLGLDITDDHIQLGATLVFSYYHRGDLTQAQLLVNRLASLSEQNGSRVARGAVYWNAAVVANSRGKVEESLALTERALALMAETDNVRHLGMLKHNCGVYLLDTESPDLDRVQNLLDEAQNALVEVGTSTEQGMLETSYARLALRQGDADGAADRASRALGLLRNEARWESASARVWLARAQFERGETQAAEDTLRAAERQLSSIPMNRSAAGVWRLAGDVWQLNGYQAEALAMYRQALSGVGLLPMQAPVKVPAGPR
ncbi:helix-turn-helix domain-containing protein [Kitasatospora sp. NBC_01250]|uniref:helix-turn-helix domain-containing protein n=1 Tax=unclassified Kitasatospora TaxID=2633591 RepID=UPI002E0EF532|nr:MULTISPECIES: helix-turn-helix domain-containing protein [unclassified Kitasatospora]WSJ67844.1 helix-turn-helix domain-containing protein [Kitasatospora sp. NBC_01302]